MTDADHGIVAYGDMAPVLVRHYTRDFEINGRRHAAGWYCWLSGKFAATLATCAPNAMDIGNPVTILPPT